MRTCFLILAAVVLAAGAWECIRHCHSPLSFALLAVAAGYCARQTKVP